MGFGGRGCGARDAVGLLSGDWGVFKAKSLCKDVFFLGATMGVGVFIPFGGSQAIVLVY